MSMTQAELDKRFDHHAPDAAKVEAHEKLRGDLKAAAQQLIALTPECREQSLALTHLEDALMWGNAAIARNL